MLNPGDKVTINIPAPDNPTYRHWDNNCDHSKALGIEHEIRNEYIKGWFTLKPGVSDGSGNPGFHQSWLTKVDPAGSKASKSCNCPLKQLLTRGCKCGGS